MYKAAPWQLEQGRQLKRKEVVMCMYGKVYVYIMDVYICVYKYAYCVKCEDEVNVCYRVCV